MTWGEHLNLVSEEESLLYWVLLCLVEPHPNRPLKKRLAYVFGEDSGISGDPDWTIERLVDDGISSYYVASDMGYHDSPFDNYVYDDPSFRKAMLETLHAVGIEYPERKQEVLETIREFNLDTGDGQCRRAPV
jgi:hypothetical protein